MVANVVPTPQTFSIDVRILTELADGPWWQQEGSVTYTPVTWRAAIERLRAAVIDRFDRPTCLLTLGPLEPGDASSDEHVILQGLGTRWIKLPPGLVSDEANNGASDAELEFLRKGLMGSLRPWYLNENNVTEFVDQYGRTVRFRSQAGKGFSINIYGEEPDVAPLVDEAHQTGTFSNLLLMDAASPIAVSRAIHKTAYLSLCVAAPELALSPLLDDARDYIVHGGKERFRPFIESFVRGASPGFHMLTRIEGKQLDHQQAIALRVVVALRLHHVLYTFAIAGTHVGTPPDSFGTLRAAPEGPQKEWRQIDFAIGGAQKLHRS